MELGDASFPVFDRQPKMRLQNKTNKILKSFIEELFKELRNILQEFLSNYFAFKLSQGFFGEAICKRVKSVRYVPERNLPKRIDQRPSIAGPVLKM